MQYLVLTHCHQDHWLNADLYPNATLIPAEPNVQLVKRARCEVFGGAIQHPDWKIIPTNGHTTPHLSIFVRGIWNGEEKNIVIAGDAFREDLWLSGYYGSADAKPGERESAEWIMNNAEVLIPGHYAVIEK